jgi:hypothetical protein
MTNADSILMAVFSINRASAKELPVGSEAVYQELIGK